MSGIAIAGSGGSGSIVIGTTTIGGGTSPRLLYDNAGVIGETAQATWDNVNNQLAVPDGSVIAGNAPGLCFQGFTSTGFAADSGDLGFWLNGNLELDLIANEYRIRRDASFSWSAATNNNTVQDTSLFRIDAATIGMATGANSVANTFQVYNSTDATHLPVNYERGTFGWSSNTLVIGTQNGGSGQVRDVQLNSVGGNIYFYNATHALALVSAMVINPSFPGLWLGSAQVTSPSVGNYALLDDNGTGLLVNTPSGTPLKFRNNNNETWQITSTGSFTGSAGAVATNATDGFLYIPSCAGTPTGTPTAVSGQVPMVYDTTNNKFYIYNGGWKGGTNPGVFT